MYANNRLKPERPLTTLLTAPWLQIQPQPTLMNLSRPGHGDYR